VLALLALSQAMTPARAARELLQLFVTQPYLELHTGPGRGYPVTQVVARGESVDVLFRRTDWFKVRTERGVEGWASARELQLATLADGSQFQVKMGDRAGFASHRWESGLFAGDYAGATLIAAFGALSLTDNLKIEVGVSQYTGNVSDGELVEIGLAHVFMPEWRFSPLVDLGTGYRWVQPKATLATPVDRSDEVGYYGVGARFYLTRRFFLRGDFRKYVVFTRTNENEVNEEWRLGFGFFY
jgi:SH3 domain-containing protein/outer membrane protein with beta-barrel domain